MTKLIFDISMSLGGFVTASNVRPEEHMGDGGQRLHEWALASTSARVRDLSKARMEQCLDKMAAIFAWAKLRRCRSHICADAGREKRGMANNEVSAVPAANDTTSSGSSTGKMLRYAIEHLDGEQRAHYLSLKQATEAGQDRGGDRL